MNLKRATLCCRTYSTMFRLACFAFMCVTTVAAQLHTRSDMRQRFGQADAQRFRISATAELLVEYNDEGGVALAQITENGNTVRAADTSKVLELLLPGITNSPDAHWMTVGVSRNIITGLTFQGCQINERFDNERLVQFQVSTQTKCPEEGARLASPFLEERYGQPVFERFLTQGNLEVGGTFDSDGKLTRIDLSGRQALMNATAAEQFITLLAPPESLEHAKGRTKHQGAARVETIRADGLDLVRTYDGSALTHAAIIWK